MVLDIELTLNRFGFYKPATNKVKFAFVRVSWWKGLGKHALSFEVNVKESQW